MLMLNNKLCLTSVVEFLRRGRVDRGTGGGKGVVVVDSSKRKVNPDSSNIRMNCRYGPWFFFPDRLCFAEYTVLTD